MDPSGLLAWYPQLRTLHIACVLLSGALFIARGASVVAVRLWPAQDYTRVTIESDGELNAQLARGFGKWKHFYDEDFYSYLSGEVLHDKIQRISGIQRTETFISLQESINRPIQIVESDGEEAIIEASSY